MLADLYETLVGCCSLNDSFAHVKRKLTAKHYQNEMMQFMWSAFRKVTGMNNQQMTKNGDEDVQMDGMEKINVVPLAKLDLDEL